MSQTRTDDPLTDLLQAADPAADDPGLSPMEQAAMRHRVLAAGRRQRARPNGWLVPAAAAMALLALALGLALRPPRGATPAAARATEPAHRQIQFTTESGTLVVWVLRPSSTG